MQLADAIVLRSHGGPETLGLEQVEVDAPGTGEILVRHSAIGVNFHDCYVRSGLYRTLDLPGIPGLEAVGIVEAVGPGVDEFSVGDRISWVSEAYGGYTSMRVLRADLAIPVPDALNDAEAAASLMKAATVDMLISHSHRLERGQTILVHAAAGGVGRLLSSWAHHLGVTVIGTVGSAEKAATARSAGVDHAILYRETDFSAAVNELTDGKGVNAVYDSVGADTFHGSLGCLGFGGQLVCYGQSSGPVPPFKVSDLAVRSAAVSRPIVFHFLRTKEQRRQRFERVARAFNEGLIDPIDPLRLPLAAAGDAHRLIESRASQGGIVLVP